MEQYPDMAQLRAIAASPEGRRFLTRLQQSGGDDLRQALASAAKGDAVQAQQLITALLQDPQLQQLLQLMGGNP